MIYFNPNFFDKFTWKNTQQQYQVTFCYVHVTHNSLNSRYPRNKHISKENCDSIASRS